MVVVLLPQSLGLLYKTVVARGLPDLGPRWAIATRARPRRAGLLGRIDGHRPFSFSKAVSNLGSKVNL